MASPQHPGGPGWTGPRNQCITRTRQEVLPPGPDLPCPGPEEAQDGPTSNSNMTTRELQEHWQKEKSRWKHVRLLFEIASARIEERKVSKFVAFGCLRAGQYARALDLLGRVVPLQEKLTAHCPSAPVPALCAMLVCLRDLERPAEAFAVGERALRRLGARESHRYYAPLLDAMVRLAYALGKDLASLQGRLDESQLRRPTHRGATLKELTVREYLS
ncbi:similar to RIKEN cDNA 9130017C17 gene [Rattus norvegicus]|uniref:Uncharacterized protein n=1 Tax=Rattus norvegicus TaxID=10116 RepID=A6KD98_RAT|nr:similar to RIKEN cDNA 9130017C17 gene [Rattus norvegicus]